MQITVLYNLFTMHNVLPHDFYGIEINDMSRKLMINFSNYEIKQRNDAIKEAGRK